MIAPLESPLGESSTKEKDINDDILHSSNVLYSQSNSLNEPTSIEDSENICSSDLVPSSNKQEEYVLNELSTNAIETEIKNDKIINASSSVGHEMSSSSPLPLPSHLPLSSPSPPPSYSSFKNDESMQSNSITPMKESIVSLPNSTINESSSYPPPPLITSTPSSAHNASPNELSPSLAINTNKSPSSPPIPTTIETVTPFPSDSSPVSPSCPPSTRPPSSTFSNPNLIPTPNPTLISNPVPELNLVPKSEPSPNTKPVPEPSLVSNSEPSPNTNPVPEPNPNQNPEQNLKPNLSPKPHNMFKLDAPKKRQSLHSISPNDSAAIITQIINKATVELDFEGARFSDVFARTLAEASAALADTPRLRDPKLLVGGKLEAIPEKEMEEEVVRDVGSVLDTGLENTKFAGLFKASHFALFMAFVSLLMFFLGSFFSILSSSNAISRTIFRSEFFFLTLISFVSNFQMYYAFRQKNVLIAFNFLLISFLLSITLVVENFISIFEEKNKHKLSSRIKTSMLFFSFFNFFISIFVFFYFKPVAWKFSQLVDRFSKKEKIMEIGNPQTIEVVSQ